MVKAAVAVKFEVLASEIEALLIEAELIRLHQPQFNILLKDDKSPIYVQIKDQPFAQVELIRKKDLLEQKKQNKTITLGPFSSAYKLQQVLKLARKIFPWCDKAQERVIQVAKNQVAKKITKKRAVDKQPVNFQEIEQQLAQFRQPCFYHHLELCPGACVGKISTQDYQDNLKQLILFLRGKKKQVVKDLTQKMNDLADDLKFEQAQQLKQKIQLIEEVTSQQYRLKPDLILPALHDNYAINSLDQLRRILLDYGLIPVRHQLKRIEGFDVSNIMGQDAAVSMVVFTNGVPDKSQYRLFNIYSTDEPNDYQMLKEAIRRRQNHREWGSPDLIVVDGGKGQVRAALSVWSLQTPIVGLAKKPDRLIMPVKHFIDQKTKRLVIKYQVINLPKDHPALRLMQQIRDESHRFAKKQHVRLRRRKFQN